MCNTKTFYNCTLYNFYKDDINNYNIPRSLTKSDLLNMSKFNYLRALPFKDVNINTWEIENLDMGIVITSIMFTNKYNFALKVNGNKYKYEKYLPTFIKDYKDKDDDNTIDHDNDTTKTKKTTKTKTTKTKKTTKSKTTKTKKTKKISAYNDDDDDKYLSNLKIAYHENNFYPIVFYPKNIIVLNYNGTNKNLKFKTLLQPISNKHKLNLQ